MVGGACWRLNRFFHNPFPCAYGWTAWEMAERKALVKSGDHAPKQTGQQESAVVVEVSPSVNDGGVNSDEVSGWSTAEPRRLPVWEPRSIPSVPVVGSRDLPQVLQGCSRLMGQRTGTTVDRWLRLVRRRCMFVLRFCSGTVGLK